MELQWLIDEPQRDVVFKRKDKATIELKYD